MSNATKTANVADTILNGYWNNGIYPCSRPHALSAAVGDFLDFGDITRRLDRGEDLPLADWTDELIAQDWLAPQEGQDGTEYDHAELLDIMAEVVAEWRDRHYDESDDDFDALLAAGMAKLDDAALDGDTVTYADNNTGGRFCSSAEDVAELGRDDMTYGEWCADYAGEPVDG